MRKLIVVTLGLISAVACFAQQQPLISQPVISPAPAQSVQAPPVQSQPPADAKAPTITIPPGTRIPVTLTTSIRTRSSRRGDIVRAVTAFPVTVGAQLAIPAGTFVEGTLEKLPKWNAAQQSTPVVHFTRIVFANGYSVPINAEITEARANAPENNPIVAWIPEQNHAGGPLVSDASSGDPSYELQQAPGLPPLAPLPKPHFGLAIGIAAGVAAAGIVVTILAIHHRGAYDAVLYDVGSQFDIVLSLPVSLDANRLAVAIAASPIQ